MANYVMPVIVGYAIVPDTSQWVSGFFTTVSKNTSLLVSRKLMNNSFSKQKLGCIQGSRVARGMDGVFFCSI